MPTSKPDILSPVAKQILLAFPTSVLDIGVGHGKWGLLAREYTDIWMRRYTRPEWKVRIEGVEIHEPYRNPVWEYAYDVVHVGNALEILPKLSGCDLCLALDVLEHFTKADGLALLRLIVEKSRTAIVSYSNCPQGTVMGNSYEAHLSTWLPADFVGLEAPGTGISSLYNDGVTNILFVKGVAYVHDGGKNETLSAAGD
jgi:hypothetical protein